MLRRTGSSLSLRRQQSRQCLLRVGFRSRLIIISEEHLRPALYTIGDRLVSLQHSHFIRPSSVRIYFRHQTGAKMTALRSEQAMSLAVVGSRLLPQMQTSLAELRLHPIQSPCSLLERFPKYPLRLQQSSL